MYKIFPTSQRRLLLADEATVQPCMQCIHPQIKSRKNEMTTKAHTERNWYRCHWNFCHNICYSGRYFSYRLYSTKCKIQFIGMHIPIGWLFDSWFLFLVLVCVLCEGYVHCAHFSTYRIPYILAQFHSMEMECFERILYDANRLLNVPKTNETIQNFIVARIYFTNYPWLPRPLPQFVALT